MPGRSPRYGHRLLPFPNNATRTRKEKIGDRRSERRRRLTREASACARVKKRLMPRGKDEP